MAEYGMDRKVLHSKLWEAGIRVSQTMCKKAGHDMFLCTIVYYSGTKRLMLREAGESPADAIEQAYEALLATAQV